MELAKIFSNNMVFQGGKPICIFGCGKGTVKVNFLGKEFTKVCDTDKWQLFLDSYDYGGPYEMNITLNDKSIVLKNVMVGEVVLCAGQSNVQFEVRFEKDSQNVLGNENVRYYLSDRIEEHDGFHSADGWVIGNQENVQKISALGFHLADFLNKKKGVAVGIIGCFQGASVIRSWLDDESLTEDVFVPIEKRHADNTYEVYSRWNKDSQMYNYTFLPIVPFGMGNVLWYQGESNTTIYEGEVYARLLEKLINLWRKKLQQPDLRFIIVEICDYEERNDDGWKCIQKAQKMATERVENTLFVTSSDVCEHNDIHPSDKRLLAEKIVNLL